MTLLKRKRAGFGDAMEVVTRFVNACNRHDADAVYACLHPEFDSIQPMFPSRNFRGADQVRRNWQAIFDAEPGFRLTVLRSAAVDDTVWLELHGAGRDAEVAGVFVMGIQGDRIRWARIYSALVEPLPAAEGATPAPAPPRTGEGEVVEESLIAPVVDIDRSGRRRRRGSRRHPEEAPAADTVVEAAPAAADAGAGETQHEVEAVEAVETAHAPDAADAAEAVEAVDAVEMAEAAGREAAAAADTEVVVEPAAGGGPETELIPVADVEVEAGEEVVVVVEAEAGADVVVVEEAAEPAAPADEGTADAEAPAAPPPPSSEPPKRRFGRRR